MAYQGEDEAGAIGDTDAAAEAFEALRGELALVRRAVERLAAERGEQPEPVDYTETLGALFQEVRETGQRIDAIAGSAVLNTSHAEVLRHVAGAVDQVHRTNQGAVGQSARDLDAATRRITAALAGAREARLQNWIVAGAVVAGTLLWATAGGPVLRAAPEGWQWPEKAAARLVRLPMWEAGQQLMRTAAPGDFARVAEADRIFQSNSEVIDRCKERARKTSMVASCVIKIPKR
jgi:hypothetical protein